MHLTRRSPAKRFTSMIRATKPCATNTLLTTQSLCPSTHLFPAKLAMHMGSTTRKVCSRSATARFNTIHIEILSSLRALWEIPASKRQLPSNPRKRETQHHRVISTCSRDVLLSSTSSTFIKLKFITCWRLGDQAELKVIQLLYGFC